jgi:hypothetical protein
VGILSLMRPIGTNIRISAIRNAAGVSWAAFPLQLRFYEPLATLERGPVELDFMISARLNYKHVEFLLQLALVTNVAEPNPQGSQLLIVSSEILGLIIEAIVSRHCLANSGTSLVWKVRVTIIGFLFD